ncbi:MAG: hydroxyisourate hydrolase [Bacteroidia bacterium]|nr:hydroxyisourate hydrolase [Bacteroidia bacterium]
MRHDPSDEILIAANEQHKITCIRLAKLIDGLASSKILSSHITTHALDTALGKPVYKMDIILKERKEKIWKPINVGVTNPDGRISDVLAPGYFLKPGSYKMIFMTKDYFAASGQEGFYPQISIQFNVTDNSHYHIPLLLSPYGFTTYRGS